MNDVKEVQKEYNRYKSLKTIITGIEEEIKSLI
jgi:hypothetical protein